MRAKLATAEVAVDQARRDAQAAQDRAEQLQQAEWRGGSSPPPLPAVRPSAETDRALAFGSAIAAVERLCQLQMLLQHRQRLLSEGLERGILS